MESKITAKGQATIPIAIRKQLGVSPGDRVKFYVHPDGSVVILPKLPASRIKGIIARRRRGVTIEQMDQAIASKAVSGTSSRRRRRA